MSDSQKKSPNPRISAKERNLIKGALRRAFSRSELRRQVIEAAVIPGYTDSSRPRVKAWCRCAVCQQPTPKYLTVADHIAPVIPVDRSFEEMSIDETVDRMWCPVENLQAICPEDHAVKSKAETKQRKEHKKTRRAK